MPAGNLISRLTASMISIGRNGRPLYLRTECMCGQWTRDVANQPLELTADIVLDDEDVRCALDKITHFVFGERPQRTELQEPRGHA